MNAALGLRFAADFFAAGFLAADFFAGAFFAGAFFAAGFLAAGFFAAGFLAAGFFAAFFAVAMVLLPVEWCERTMPIDLKRTVLSRVPRFIGADYSAFSRQ